MIVILMLALINLTTQFLASVKQKGSQYNTMPYQNIISFTTAYQQNATHLIIKINKDAQEPSQFN